MKNKKLLALLMAALATVAVSATAVTGCSSGNETNTHTEHTYGEWTVTTTPTQTTTGTATRECSGCDEEEELTLPALSDSRYTITNDTATETAAGTGTYTITLNGETISFTAATPATGTQGTDVEVTGIALDKTTATIAVGGTVTLTATVSPNDATDNTVTWSSSDEAVATVSGGVVTGVATGSATITAKAGEYTATCTITVSDSTVEVTEITLSTTAAEVEVGESVTVIAAVSPADATENTVNWTTSDSSIASITFISNTVIVKGVSEGTATITATAGGKSATCTITVSAAETHNYGDWEVTVTPTETTAGTAVRTCTDDGCTKSETVTLPALSDSGYYIGASDTDGKSTYTITVDGYEITFEADSVYEDVTTYADIVSAIASVGTSTKTTENLTIGKFTFGAGVYFESSTSNLSADTGNTTYGIVNNQQKAIYFTVSGTTNSVSFDMKGANSCTMSLYKEDGTELKTWDQLTDSAVQADCEVTGLSAGTYYLQSVGSARIANLAVTEKVEKSNTTGITATAGAVDFLMGRTVTASDLALSVTLNYANGRTDSLTDGYTTDIATALNTEVSGSYVVTVTYGDYEAEVTVNIYAIDSITVSDHSLNSGRETINVQTIYLAGANTLNTTGVAVTATAKCGDLEAEFVLTSDEYTFGTVDLSTAGTKTVTVTASEKQATYEINVISLSSEIDKTTVNVDASAESVGEDATTHIVTVTKINDALKLFELYGVEDEDEKTINVAEGEYFEKVYIDMPNVTLIGSNTGNNTNETVIVYNAMNGLMDPSGTTTYSTTGSATVTITSNAANFTAKNITFKNYYNTHELYQEALTITSSTQADACYVEGDMAYFENVTFTSYHDTLEAESGRQYYYNCYIEGRTDYIFGNDATAYFYKCTIHSIGAGTTEKNGGYVIATKGSGVTYGYIFNECTFEGDDNVQAGSVSVARAWASGMTIMIMNSTFDDSFSLEGYGYTASNLNDRYTVLSVAPVASQLFEYNNTGVGAITVQEVEGVYTVGTYDEDGTFTALDGYVIGALDGDAFTPSTDGTGIVYQTVTDEENNVTYYAISTIVSSTAAADYCDFGTIFALTNGTVKYTAEWAGSNEVYTVNIYTTDDTTTSIATVKVYAGTTLTSTAITSAANAVLSESSLQVSAIYTDSAAAETSVYTDVKLTTADQITAVYVTTETKKATTEVEYTLNMSNVVSSSVTLAAGTYYFTTSGYSTTDSDESIISYYTKSTSDKFASKSITYNDVSYSYYLQMNGATSDSNGRIITIDLSAYAGRTVSVTVLATATKDTSQLLLNTDQSTSTSTALANTTVSSTVDETAVRTLTYSGTVSSDGLYYLTAVQTMRVYAIIITIE